MSGSIQQSTSLNRYAYANRNPISYIDPFGLSAEAGINWIQNNGHEILDVLGMLTSVGVIFDTANLVWYLAEGDWVNAAFSAMALLPVIGEAAGAGKVVGTSVKVVESQALEAVAKYGDDVAKVADELIVQKTTTSISKQITNAVGEVTENVAEQVVENVVVQTIEEVSQDISVNNYSNPYERCYTRS